MIRYDRYDIANTIKRYGTKVLTIRGVHVNHVYDSHTSSTDSVLSLWYLVLGQSALLLMYALEMRSTYFYSGTDSPTFPCEKDNLV